MAGEVRRRKLRALLRLAGVAAREHDVDAFEAAFVHESAVKERRASHSNERLEFLGDALLGFIVSRSLYERYPSADEGELALRKASLVSDAALATTAERLGIEPLLVLGAGLANAPAARRRSALADAFEAFVAALQFQCGIEAAARFVLVHHVAELERTGMALDDPKTVLQEWMQKRFARLPVYDDRCEGPAHERTFHAEVTVDGDLHAAGSGSSKKAAQRQAAAHALERLKERYDDVSARSLSQPVHGAESFGDSMSKRRRP